MLCDQSRRTAELWYISLCFLDDTVIEANLPRAFGLSDALKCHQSFPSSLFSGSASSFSPLIQEEIGKIPVGPSRSSGSSEE